MSAPDAPEPLPPEALCPALDPSSLPPQAAAAPDAGTAGAGSAAAGLPGQERAARALDFATRVRQKGFNAFVHGPEGSGRRTSAVQVAERAARARPAPDDWIYVHNFETDWKPRALSLPAGRAIPFRDAVAGLVEQLRTAIPALFKTDAYRERRRQIDERFQERQNTGFEAIEARAHDEGIGILRTPMGFAFAPMRDGEVVKPDAFQKLPAEERKRIQDRIGELQTELAALMRKMPEEEEKRRNEIRALNAEMAQTVVDAAIAGVRPEFADVPAAAQRLDEMRGDLIDNVELFVLELNTGEESPFPEASMPVAEDPRFRRYLVNVVIANGGGGHAPGAPVVYEDHPTLARLIGRVDHTARMGALETDFSMIRAGALHRANGGFLVVDALRLLREPLSWDALKRALRSGRIAITSAAEELSLLSTVSLEPEPIPLDVKILMIGEPLIYHLLSALDPEFGELFKVEADFDDRMPRDEATIAEYARLIGATAAREGLRPLDPGAVAAAIGEATRMTGDAERLSLKLGQLADLLAEADHWAADAGRERVAAEDIARAIAEREFRADGLRQRWHEGIGRGTVMIDTEGARVGQINGLTVIAAGHAAAFGAPSRITARVRMGSGHVIDIERETKLGGPIHSKGVLILSSYLAATFATEAPMSLWASLVFEQSYGGVEGDSASSAELYALLSALSGLALRQDLAVTGSVNQLGQVQAIGGVNEKIEGFFDICAARGLTGDQGVLIPSTNVKHLVLRPRVVEAAAAGRFHIYPVATIDEGIALLTGHDAGTRGPDGRFPEGSVNARVEATLAGFARARKAFGAKDEDGETGAERRDDDEA
ncbi:AAA family ATPase [Limibaculum sp. FT325]|uniref:Lon protease family protein n=1 Tax=Thermohalobaculum sediminis TaxID=2939436 RepID=UPI0020BFDBA8|nr:ATP-binding protein [Limibaculum sediminis]MCL5779056.1 AAA family ATPase [Limibaculum sediminis]